MPYGYGGGMPGCLFDYGPHACESLDDAIDSLHNLYELTDEEKDLLREEHILYFKGDRAHEVGAHYCKVWEMSQEEYENWKHED